jgi:hypothetical protein
MPMLSPIDTHVYEPGMKVRFSVYLDPRGGEPIADTDVVATFSERAEEPVPCSLIREDVPESKRVLFHWDVVVPEKLGEYTWYVSSRGVRSSRTFFVAPKDDEAAVRAIRRLMAPDHSLSESSYLEPGEIRAPITDKTRRTFQMTWPDISTLRETTVCPCGIARVDCEYHR